MENKNYQQMFEEYQQEFINLENSWADEAGYYPLVSSIDFWANPRVRLVECMLLLFWDLKEIRKAA